MIKISVKIWDASSKSNRWLPRDVEVDGFERTFGVVIEKSSLCLQEGAAREDGFEFREGLVSVFGSLIQLLAAVNVKDESHNVLGKVLDNLFQL